MTSLAEPAHGVVPAARAALVRRAAPVALLVAVAAVAAGWRGGFKDLLVYQYGGRAVLDGLALYRVDDPTTGLPFTYPPFAAVVMVPLSWMPAWVAAAVWTGGSVTALAATVALVRRALGRPVSGWWLVAVCAGALLVEPVWQTLTFGQINLLLMFALLIDLTRAERRWSGVLVGLAAGVKLTPLVFVVFLALVGRRSSALRATAVFVVTVGIGFAAMPTASTSYWTDGLVDARRVGPPALAHNQSVYGALARLLDGQPSALLWLAVAVPLSLAVVGIAVAQWRCGDRLLGACLAALAMLMASPVSWSHHWVWAIPIALVLWERSRWAAVSWTLVFLLRPFVWLPFGHNREYSWTAWEHVPGNAYLLAAMALSTWAAMSTRDRSSDDPELTAHR